MTGLSVAMVFWSELTECADLQDVLRQKTVWSGQKVSSAATGPVVWSAKKASSAVRQKVAWSDSAAMIQADGSAKKAWSAA